MKYCVLQQSSAIIPPPQKLVYSKDILLLDLSSFSALTLLVG